MHGPIGILYLAGAVCWVINAYVSGWGQHGQHVTQLLGVTAVLGAALFHLGAMCQVWSASIRMRKAAARLPSLDWNPSSFLDQQRQLLLSSASSMTEKGDAGAAAGSGARTLVHSSSSSSRRLPMSRSLTSRALGRTAEATDHHQQLYYSDSGTWAPAPATTAVAGAAAADSCCQQDSPQQVRHRGGSTNGCSPRWSNCSCDGGRDLESHGCSEQCGAADDAVLLLGLPCTSDKEPAATASPAAVASAAASGRCQLQETQLEVMDQDEPVVGSGLDTQQLVQASTHVPPLLQQQPQQGQIRFQELSHGLHQLHTTTPFRQGSISSRPQRQPSGGSPTGISGMSPVSFSAFSVVSVQDGQHRGKAGPGPLGSCCSWLQELETAAAVVQVTGTTIFLAACIAGLPGLLPTNYEAGDWVMWDIFFWAPFLVGSCLFITSAALSLRDSSTNTYALHVEQPALASLAWWMHLLNLLGSIGFWLCSFFGFFAYPAQRFQRWGTAFNCLWGSCCFAVAASLQLRLAYPGCCSREVLSDLRACI